MFMLNELLIKELSEQVGINTSDIQNIKDGEIYSTSEVKTNKKWIDAKPIYRKVFISTWGNINVSELNIDTMIDTRGMVSYTNGWHPLNAYANANFNSLVQYSTKEKNIQFYGNGYNNSQIILILEYTKTTD